MVVPEATVIEGEISRKPAGAVVPTPTLPAVVAKVVVPETVRVEDKVAAPEMVRVPVAKMLPETDR